MQIYSNIIAFAHESDKWTDVYAPVGGSTGRLLQLSRVYGE